MLACRASFLNGEVGSSAALCTQTGGFDAEGHVQLIFHVPQVCDWLMSAAARYVHAAGDKRNVLPWLYKSCGQEDPMTEE